MGNKKTDKFILKPLLKVLGGEKSKQIPFWFMRQAGRYLPEYRDLRKQAGSFLDLVYNPQQASEVTMQPIRRFGMSGAILFSDILVIPQALGQALRFETGEGPKLDKIESEKDFSRLNIDKIDETLSPIYETISLVRSKLKSEEFDQTSLIGFAGSPWTVMCYMIEGGGSKTFEKTKIWAYQNPKSFQKLMDIVVEATTHYLLKQIEAGAEAIQLFDSWSGILDEDNFQRWVIEPTCKIIHNLKEKYPEIPVIGFPREAGAKYIPYIQQTNISALGVDFSMPLIWTKENLQTVLPIQGNLDPVILLTGGDVMKRAANNILETFIDKPFIFNLGHGVIKETPVHHVEELSQIIRDFKS